MGLDFLCARLVEDNRRVVWPSARGLLSREPGGAQQVTGRARESEGRSPGRGRGADLSAELWSQDNTLNIEHFISEKRSGLDHGVAFHSAPGREGTDALSFCGTRLPR